MLLANFDRKEHLQHRAVSLRQHGFLVLTKNYVLFYCKQKFVFFCYLIVFVSNLLFVNDYQFYLFFVFRNNAVQTLSNVKWRPLIGHSAPVRKWKLTSRWGDRVVCCVLCPIQADTATVISRKWKSSSDLSCYSRQTSACSTSSRLTVTLIIIQHVPSCQTTAPR